MHLDDWHPVELELDLDLEGHQLVVLLAVVRRLLVLGRHPVLEAVVTDPLRGVRASSGVNKAKSTEVEFSRLKNLVPSISRKQSVSQLDVILEAIRYIDSLQDQLIEQIQDRRLPVQAAEFLVGKENTIKVDSQQQFKTKKEEK